MVSVVIQPRVHPVQVTVFVQTKQIVQEYLSVSPLPTYVPMHQKLLKKLSVMVIPMYASMGLGSIFLVVIFEFSTLSVG